MTKKNKAHIQTVNKLIELRKGQIKVIEMNLIKPLKDSIKICNEYKQHKQNLKNVLHINEVVSKHIKGIIN